MDKDGERKILVENVAREKHSQNEDQKKTPVQTSTV
jgi:hypothetical protein